MHKTMKHKHAEDYDLYDDLAKIKAALREASLDIKGKAGAILSDSLEDIGERSQVLKENVNDYIEEKPFKAVGIAMLIGGLIGYLLHK